jgi:acetoacetate decarboxylase
MTRDEIFALPSMPPGNPSYPRGPYRFINREYLVIAYESDPDAIRHTVPEPMEPDGSNQVFYECIAMLDASGFGSYTESGLVIPCTCNGEAVNYTAQMYLNDEPPITAAREIWGFPKRYGHPKLEVVHDTLTGTLHYAGERVATGTMAYKHESAGGDLDACKRMLEKTQVNLKLIPCVTGEPKIAQLVAYNLTEVCMKGFWTGPARLHLIPHVNAPVADLPVKPVRGGRHFIADLTLPYGRVLHDYLVVTADEHAARKTA